MIDLAIGVATAVGSAAAYGSFGVPIKCKRILDAKVDPLAYQCYKSLVCFLTSWLVLTYNHFSFTWWGTVGATIWVVNGVCAIIAIQKAGLGITQTTWSAVSIFVSFIWGAFVFHEPIKSLPLSFVGLILMAIGMAGLGFAARQVAPVVIASNLSVKPVQLTEGGTRDCENCTSKTTKEFERVPSAESQEVDAAAMPLAENDEAGAKALVASKNKDFIIGVALACWIGLTNGSFLVPLKYAHNDVKGIIYVLSFGIGSAMVTLVAVACYASACKFLVRPIPSLQIKVASGPALLTGLLWSAGNFLSIYAVNYLGLSLGWPLVQCQLIVSSLWAILYYREIKGWKTIAIFVLSTACILVGVFVLASYGV